MNAYFISLGAGLVLSLFKIPKVDEMSKEEWDKARGHMIRNTAMLLIPALVAAAKVVLGL